MFNTADWLMTPKRIGLIEFVMSTKDVYLLALTPKPAKFDMGLFVRPFTTESWIGKTLLDIINTFHTFLVNSFLLNAFFSYSYWSCSMFITDFDISPSIIHQLL